MIYGYILGFIAGTLSARGLWCLLEKLIKDL